MTRKCAVSAVTFAVGTLLYGPTLSHGAEKHGKAKPADAQMKKMHQMMPMLSKATASLETALAKGDLATTEAESGRILSALPDLEKAKPHKNHTQHATFVELVKKEKLAVATTLDLAKKREFAAAQAAFKKVEAVCAECHAKFRD